mgnify:CR=1 FL=1
MELHIVTEANRCLNCKKPMCQQGCPIHNADPQGHQPVQRREDDGGRADAV